MENKMNELAQRLDQYARDADNVKSHVIAKDLREAASALRSRGEAVAWLHTVVQGDGPEDQALSFAPDNFPFKDVGGFRSLRAAPLYLHPATPASAWRPKVEDFLRRLATMQPPNVVLQQITMLGEARDLLREAITPPTSTKGG